MRPFLRRSIRPIILILVLSGALLIGGSFDPFVGRAAAPLIALQTWFASSYNSLVNFFSTPRDVAALQQRNAELENEVARLQSQVIALREQNAEIQVLSALVEFARQDPASDYVAAAVIGKDPSPFLHYIFINRGSDDGILRGMPVVNSQGLVGRVAAVTAGAARIQLITDPQMAINIRLETSQASAVLKGGITGELGLELIPQEADVQTGELVLTSGLGGSYPPNILIGQVTGLRSRSFDLFQTASVQPVVDFSQLEVVLIIRNFQPIDITPLLP